MVNINKFDELRKFVMPEYIFGNNSIELAGHYAQIFGLKKVLIATDPGVILSGWADIVIKKIEQAGIEYSIFSDISPNPRDFEVMNGAAFFKNEFCDGIVAVGGGSVIDCAKGIGIVAVNEDNILNFEGVNKVDYPMPPLICIPTTGGTSADVSQFAIINNSGEKYKFAIISKAVVPDLAIIDPLTLTSMDSFLTACTGMDVLSHAFEAYASTAATHMTDLLAKDAVKLLIENLPKTFENPDDIDARGNVMLASLEAGLAFSNASLGCVHSLAHSLGGYKDMPHGLCNSILLPFVVEYNFDYNSNKYIDLLKLFAPEAKNITNSEAKKALFQEISMFKESLRLTESLANYGISSSDLLTLSEKAIADPCNATNPRAPKVDDISSIYSEAL